MLSLDECQSIVAAESTMYVRSDTRDPETMPYYKSAYRAQETVYLPTVFDLLNAQAPKTALDLGCAWGTTSLFLASLGTQVVAVDNMPLGHFFAPGLLDHFSPNLQFVQADVEHQSEFNSILGYCSQAEVIVMTQVIPHLKFSPVDTLQRIASSMRRDASFLTTFISRDDHPHILPVWNHWSDIPHHGHCGPHQQSVTCMYDDVDAASLLNSVFGDVRIWRGESGNAAKIIFAECKYGLV